MSAENNVIDIRSYRDASQQELIDDISAQAFLFLRSEAEDNNLPMKSVLMEHLLGLGLVIKAVEGASEAKNILAQISEQLEAY